MELFIQVFLGPFSLASLDALTITILRDGLVTKGKYSECLGDHMEESSPPDLDTGPGT